MREVLSGALSVKQDSHIHTVFSDGRDTIEEMICAADSIGLDYIVITDHARQDSTYIPQYVREISLLQAKYPHICIRRGLEVKFLDSRGTLDYQLSWSGLLDYLVVSFHSFPYQLLKAEGPLAFKSAWFKALRNFSTGTVPVLKNLNPNIKLVVGHPFSLWKKGGIKPTVEEICSLISLANTHGLALEINVNPKHYLGQYYTKLIVQKCRDFVLGSDSHSAEELKELAPYLHLQKPYY